MNTDIFNTREPRPRQPTITILTGDAQAVAAELAAKGERFHASLSDPPYGLGDPAQNRKAKKAVEIFLDVGLPKLHEIDSEILEESDLALIPFERASLRSEQIISIIESGVSVPKGSVDLDGDLVCWEKEVEAGTESTRFRISDRMLRLDLPEVEEGEFLGDYVLEFGDTGDAPLCNGTSDSLANLTLGGLTMRVVPALTPGRDCLLGALLPRLSRGVADGVGLDTNALGDPLGSPFVRALSRAVDPFVLAFDLTGATGELVPTARAGQRQGSGDLASAKLVRAFPRARGLPSVFEPCRVSMVLDTANGAVSAYFHVWIHRSRYRKCLKSIPSSGFMGKGWDRNVPGPDLWGEVLNALHPGAHIIAFGGTRTWHHLALALEDAGAEMRDTLMWLYGTGFPKNHNVGKAIDKAAGAEREVVGSGRSGRARIAVARDFAGAWDVTAPATAAAKRWQGHGTALKPAWEPALLFRKPLEQTIARTALTHNAGTLAIDASRIEVEAPTTALVPANESEAAAMDIILGVADQGRWPANVILDEEAGAVLDAQTKGSSRFFYCAKASRKEREAGLEGFEASNVNDGRETSIDNAYQRGDTKRRNTHPTVKPLDLIRYLAGLLLPPEHPEGAELYPRKILVPFSGSGSEVIACAQAGWDHVVGIELNPEYVEIARARIAHWIEASDLPHDLL